MIPNELVRRRRREQLVGNRGDRFRLPPRFLE
jgi:hypothetical protein